MVQHRPIRSNAVTSRSAFRVEDTPVRRARHAITYPVFEFRELLAVRPETPAASMSRRPARTSCRDAGATIAYDLLCCRARLDGSDPLSYDDDVHPYAD